MNVILLPPADLELQDAIDFYDGHMNGLGDRFYNCFLGTVQHIKSSPELWRKVGVNTRRINISGFPFLVLYIVDQENIFITCVAHQHRDPLYYINRLS